MLGELHHDLGHAQVALGVGAEIPGPRMRRRLLDQALAKQQITRQRFEHMLPGSGRAGVAQHADLAVALHANQIAHPVTVADDTPTRGSPGRARC